MKNTMKKQCSSISSAIRYMHTREAAIVKETAEIKHCYGNFSIEKLIRGWVKAQLAERYFTLLDLTEIVSRAFRLTLRQSVEVIHNELEVEVS